jgi:Protein of unknown function (DUF3303).
MKFMITWRIPVGCYKAAAERFLSTGAPDAAGMKTLGRWHVPASYSGWHLVEGDPVAVAELHAGWADVLELEIAPVLDDSEAATGIAKTLKK